MGKTVEEINAGDLARAVEKARRRLVPFLFVLYIVAYLDRINIGFAALQMNAALGLSASAYALGASIFFVGYTLFEVPSNIILARVGARIWIARIMISWGIVSTAMMFVRTAGAFYALRFLLGAAEAGFFPGIIYYLTQWFPSAVRARTVASFMTAVLIAGVVGGPISGALLRLDGAGGLAGWQWLFLIEGLPAILMGVVVLRMLDDSPAAARWLELAERSALTAALTHEQGTHVDVAVWTLLRNRRVWLLAALYFTIPVTLYGVGFWLPQMLKSASASGTFTIGVLSAIPYAAAATVMVSVGRRSDRTGERRLHVFIPAVVCVFGLALAALGTSTTWTLVSLSVAMAGLASIMGPFWALATASLRGIGAAAAIGLINSIGNTGGFVGPYLLGAINDATHSFALGLVAIALMLIVGGALVFLISIEPNHRKTNHPTHCVTPSSAETDLPG